MNPNSTMSVLAIKHPDYCRQLTRLLPQFSAVFNWNVASLFKFKRRIDTELFAGSFSECLRPTDFPWISLFLECTMAFCTAESEHL